MNELDRDAEILIKAVKNYPLVGKSLGEILLVSSKLSPISGDIVRDTTITNPLFIIGDLVVNSDVSVIIHPEVEGS